MYNEKLNYENATGPIEYGMTVDYMFRVVLQKSKPALKGLVMSILRLQEEEIDDVVVLNPINPGEHISDKEIRMDVRVLLNDDTKLDLEMQVKNNKDWPERSVVYLCREFDSLSVGEDYETVKSIYQIGFLDFNLFDDHPEFCGRYQLRNEKDGYLYSSKLNLCVVQLNHTELATDEDSAYGIDKWAKVFKASTWEELKMVAQNNEFMSATAESIFLANQDYNVRKVIRERQEHEMYVEKIEKENKTLKNEVTTLSDENASLSGEINSLSDEVASLRKLLEEHGIKAPK